MDNMRKLIKESGIRDINNIAKRYKKAKIYFHQDLDGVTTALAMKNFWNNKELKLWMLKLYNTEIRSFQLRKLMHKEK